MALAVVNYPTVSPQDFEWMQSIREKYDPLYFSLIDPHLTFVFPTENIEEADLIQHVRTHAAGLAPFEAVFRCAILGDADFQDHAHAFLMPDEGFSQIVRLHDRLYTGLLQPELRLDLPFFPHIAFANAPELPACKAIVDEVNSEKFELRARVENLEVVGFDGRRVWTIEQIALSGEGE